MDNKILQAYNGMVLFLSERTNLFTLFLILLLVSSVFGNFQNAFNNAKIAKMNEQISILNTLAKKEDIRKIENELKHDNWGLYKRTITAIGDVNDSAINPDTGMVIYKRHTN